MGSKKQRREIPRFQQPIIETHCHLDYLEAEQLETTLARSKEVGITRIVTIAVSPDNLATVLELAHSHSQIWCTQGVHPHEAEHYNATVAATIDANARDPRVLAIGEIGLDYYYDHADRQVQRNVFEAQLEQAITLDLPVVIHTREADADTRAILANVSGALQRKGVIHSFTSSLELAEYCLGEGFCLGFNGITTFNSAQNVRDVVAATPLAQILLETDAPYLTPIPYRGKPNAPFYLPFIAEKVAAIKQCEVEELLTQAWQNSCRTFAFD